MNTETKAAYTQKIGDLKTAAADRRKAFLKGDKAAFAEAIAAHDAARDAALEIRKTAAAEKSKAAKVAKSS